MAEQMVSSYAGRFTLTDEEESDLEEIFQQCIEIQGGEATLSELSMMFCRSRFAERSSLFLDCYNEFLEVWQLARPLHLRRYILNHRKSFVVSGVNVRCHVEPKIPTELLEAVWYLKDFILDKFSGVVKVPSLVRALLNEGAFVHSGLRRIVGETDDEVRRFLNACFSVFKIHRKTDIIYVIGSKSTLADPVAANAIDKMLKQLRIRPCKISELVATDTEDVLLNFNSLYAFVVSFPFVFEVKKGSDGLDAIVFAMERHEDELYKALDEISQGREVSSATVKDCFQMFVRCLSKNGGSVDLSSEIDLLEAVFQDSRLTAFLSPRREDLVTFLSLFSPPFFTIEQGKVALVENPETIGVPGFSKLAKEAISYADKVKENWKVPDRDASAHDTDISKPHIETSKCPNQIRDETANEDAEHETWGELAENCFKDIKAAGGLVPSPKLSLEELSKKYAHDLSKLPLVNSLEKFPEKFYLTPDRHGIVLVDVINSEVERLRPCAFRGFAQFLASDIATYGGSLPLETITDHTCNLSDQTFQNASVVKGNVASLTAFLASFPSLFCLDRNAVHVNPDWWEVLWPASATENRGPGSESGRVAEPVTKAESEGRADAREGVVSSGANVRSQDVAKACVHCLKRNGGLMSVRMLVMRIRHSGLLGNFLKCPQLPAEKRLLRALLLDTDTFLITPDQTGVVSIELLEKENERLGNAYVQDLVRVVTSILVAPAIPLPVAAVSRCVFLSKELTGDTFQKANVARGDGGSLGAFLLSLPSLFAFEDGTFSGRVGLVPGWREALNSVGMKLVPSSNVETVPTEQKHKPTGADSKAHDDKFQFCLDVLEHNGGTTSLDALVAEYQYSEDLPSDNWLQLQKQFADVLQRHTFHFMLTPDKRGIVLRSVFAAERSRLTSPPLLDFVTHAAVDLLTAGGALPLQVLHQRLLRLGDETFADAQVFKGDAASLAAFLASFPSVFCFDKTGDTVSLTKSWLSVASSEEKPGSERQGRSTPSSDGDWTAAAKLLPTREMDERGIDPSGVLQAPSGEGGGSKPLGSALPGQTSPAGDATGADKTLIGRQLEERAEDLSSPSFSAYKRLRFTRDGRALYSDLDSPGDDARPVDDFAWSYGPQLSGYQLLFEKFREQEGALFVTIFPEVIQSEISEYVVADVALEVIMLAGKLPALRYINPCDQGRTLTKQLIGGAVTYRMLREFLSQPGVAPLPTDDRYEVDGTLHRVRVLKNAKGKTTGLTARYGRWIFGDLSDMVQDLLCPAQSVLIVGEPGVGKTTIMREFARVLDSDFRKKVVIVDTWNEIAGVGCFPHISVGRPVPVQVQPRDSQHRCLAESFRDHDPDVIVIDELASEEEAEATRLISEGVQLVASAHVPTFEDLLTNKALWPLIGGLRPVTPPTDKKNDDKDIAFERSGPTAFDALIEVQERDRWLVHIDLQASVDSALKRQPVVVEIRERVHQDEASMVQATLRTINTEALKIPA